MTHLLQASSFSDLTPPICEFLLNHFHIQNSTILIARMHELTKSIAFLKDAHRRLDLGYRFEDESGPRHIQEIGNKLKIIEKENKHLVNIFRQILDLEKQKKNQNETSTNS